MEIALQEEAKIVYREGPAKIRCKKRPMISEDVSKNICDRSALLRT
jgi:hypothetical protein